MAEPASIRTIEAEIVDEFSLFDNWEDKYEYIIDMGKKLPVLEDKHKKDENKIRGCQSTVWMVSEYRDGKVFYKADSDAVIQHAHPRFLRAETEGYRERGYEIYR